MIKRIHLFICLLIAAAAAAICVASILYVKNSVDNMEKLLEASSVVEDTSDTQDFLQKEANIYIDEEHGGKTQIEEKEYNVYQNNELIGSFGQYIHARQFAEGYTRSHIAQKGKRHWIWNNYPALEVYADGMPVGDAVSFKEAMELAGKYEEAEIRATADKRILWSDDTLKKSSIIEGVPHILQNPELPRGCEVTSLAMLLQFAGEDVTKMELADKVRKNDAVRVVKSGEVYYGNPNNGFVGDMTTFSKPGLGVYHEPIYELIKEYLPVDAVDLTGAGFEAVMYYLNKGVPVWVIINAWYKELPNSRFETWHTEDGELQITYLEHSVCVVGYDEDYIYYNDPLKNNGGYSKSAKKDFIKAWVQMGSQAISYSRVGH